MDPIDLSSLACPGCHEPVDDDNEGFTHLDESALCNGASEPTELAPAKGSSALSVRTKTDADALDVIAHILRDPEWSSGMLEDIAEAVVATGRNLDALPGNESTWIRH